jgi:putative FmdB family regulatory protein
MKRKDHERFDFAPFRSYIFLYVTSDIRSKTMPIFEFRCLECGDIFEKLFINSNDEVDMACPKCKSQSLERVVSRTNYAMGVGPGGNQPKMTTKHCGPSNQCTTLELPGHTK